MRVLMVAHDFPRHESDGSGVALWRLAEALTERGHGVRVLAPAHQGDVGPSMLGRVEVRRLRYAAPSAETLAHHGTAPPPRTPTAGLAFLGLVRAIRRAAAEELHSGGFHLVHAWGWLPAAAATALADRHGRPFVVTLQGRDLRRGRAFPGSSLLLAAALRPARVITAASSHLADEAARLMNIPRARFMVTPPPLLDIATATPLDGIPHGVVFVGRLTKDKGVAILLDALSLLKKQGLPLDLTIVGDGPERVMLKAQALALGVPVVFTGHIAPEQIPDHIAGKRVCALPGTEAGSGRVIAEALAQGVPCVATKVGAHPEWLTEDGAGILVPPGDTIALAGALREVVQNDSYLTGAVNAGRAVLARHTPAEAATQLEQAYAEARGRRSSGARTARVSQP